VKAFFSIYTCKESKTDITTEKILIATKPIIHQTNTIKIGSMIFAKLSTILLNSSSYNQIAFCAACCKFAVSSHTFNKTTTSDGKM